MPDDLHDDFQKSGTAFEARMRPKTICRFYWIMPRRGGKASCAKCERTRVWTIREGI